MVTATASASSFDLITTSPMIRCHHFAKEYAKRNQLPLNINQQLREICFGDWDGEAMTTLYQNYPQQLDKFWKTPWQFTPPNGEAMAAFSQRIDEVWEQLIAQRKHTLVVCHSGIIRYLMAKVLGMPIPGNQHLIALDIGFAAKVEIDIVIEDNGKVWQTLRWPS